MPSEQSQTPRVGAALVVGGGIGGMQAALDLAAGGIKVYVVDSRPAIGGVMAQLDKTFPTNDCAMCTMAPPLRIGMFSRCLPSGLNECWNTCTAGRINFSVTIKKRPRFVNESKCTGCGTCVANCPVRNQVQPLESLRIELELPYREKVAAIVMRNKNRDGPLMPILQEVNAAFNYFPENVLGYIAQETGYSFSHVYRIATFYSAFSVVPRGKYVINVCMGTTCYVRGSERLMDRFADTLKIKPEETTPDMLFTLKAVRCIGCCGLAPAVMVGDSVYGKLAVKEVVGIANKFRGVNGHGQADTG